MSGAYRIVIPCRLAATRLPRKPLLDVAGRPLIQRVVELAGRTRAAEVLVATEDQEIVAAVEAFGGEAMLTASTHASGTDRLAEVVERRGWSDDTIVVNLQGDEPGMESELLDRAAGLLEADPSAGIATFGTPIRGRAELFDPNVVKVVRSASGHALYFSRAPIPWVREDFAVAGQDPSAALPDEVPFLRHLGLYAYRARTLRAFAALPASPLEQAERLEQLRALEAGERIAVGVIERSPAPGVDTPEDLARVRALFAGAAP